MNKEENKISLVAVYGTLRPGHGNYNWHLNNRPGVEHLGTETVGGFRMYSLGGFPGVLRGEESDNIIIDVFRVENNDVMRGLDMLEGYNQRNPKSGLYDKETVNTSHGEAYIYTYNGEPSEDRLIENGDWSDHVTKRRSQLNISSR